jgi:hypothetical protein
MEGLTRLVAESLARHGFDRPLDYRRLHWSRWFRCDSHHSLLSVPSKPGVFAVAEEVMDFGHNADSVGKKDDYVGGHYVGTAASAVQRSEASAAAWARPEAESRKPEAVSPRRMLAVTQFFEDDDMAFVLDRMLSRQNPMAARLASGRYFVRFVVIEDATQRRSICSALNQWMVSAAEKATGIGAHFATSLELTPATEYIPQPDESQQSLFPKKEEENAEMNVARAPSPATAGDIDIPAGQDARVGQDAHVGRTLLPANADTTTWQARRSDAILTAPRSSTAPHLNSGAATNIHCPSPFPSGF